MPPVEKIISITGVYICPELKIPGAQTSHSGMAQENTVVTVTCLKQKHYVLFGEKEVTCQSTGWSHDPECRKFGKSSLIYAVLILACYHCAIQISLFHVRKLWKLVIDYMFMFI